MSDCVVWGDDEISDVVTGRRFAFVCPHGIDTTGIMNAALRKLCMGVACHGLIFSFVAPVYNEVAVYFNGYRR